jgi:hypothetical protein
LLFFGKGFDGDHLVVSESFSQVDSGKSAFSNFFFSFEKFVKVPLVDFLLEFFHPEIEDGHKLRVKSDFLVALLSFEPESKRPCKIALGVFLMDK